MTLGTLEPMSAPPMIGMKDSVRKEKPRENEGGWPFGYRWSAHEDATSSTWSSVVTGAAGRYKESIGRDRIDTTLCSLVRRCSSISRTRSAVSPARSARTRLSCSVTMRARASRPALYTIR